MRACVIRATGARGWFTSRLHAVARAAASALWLMGCSADELDIAAVGRLDYAGRVSRIETLGRYSSSEASLLFRAAGNHAVVSTENSYFLYRVTYPTAAVHAGVTTVSGLVAVPATRRIKGIVSWQHGTNTDRQNSISKPSIPEGLGVSALFASDGFMVVAPDYIGLGVSHDMQAYYHWPSTVSSVVDLLLIAQIMLDSIAVDPDRDLYLAGFSQGGGATAAVQRFLEANNPTGLRLRGAATMAAEFNPAEIGLRNAIASDNPFYLAFLLVAFADVYGQSLDRVVQEPYNSQLASWFDGSHDQAFFDQHLPRHVNQLLTAQFLRAEEAGAEDPPWFYDALRLARTDDYAPQAPLRIHFGSQDSIVIPDEARAAFTHMQALAGNVELVDVGPYNHDQIVLHSLPSIQRWFDSLGRNTR
jgi:hypothetical protein